MVEEEVRQGCSLSPVLFNIYAEALVRDALSNPDERMKGRGELVKEIRFTDDKAFASNT